MYFWRSVAFESFNSALERVLMSINECKLTYLTNVPTFVDIHSFCTEVARNLGKLYVAGEAPVSGEQTQEEWLDVTYNPDCPYRYRYSNTRQPLHTDSAYVNIKDCMTFFYCVEQANAGGATTFLDTKTLVECLVLDNEHELLHDLQTVPMWHTKDDRERLSPILLRDVDKIYWNPTRVDRKRNASDVLYVMDQFFAFMEERIERANVTHAITLKRQDAVFFHDERLLHGRNAFFTKARGGRSLKKGIILLNSPVSS